MYQLEKTLVVFGSKNEKAQITSKEFYNANERHTKSLENLNTAGGAERAFSNSKVLLATRCEC